MNIAEKFIKTNGITFEVERNGKVISEILGYRIMRKQPLNLILV